VKIRFKGDAYFFISRHGDDLNAGGAIATEEQFVNGLTSYAHLFRDGVIRRFKLPIGTIADLEVIDHSDPPFPTEEALCRILTRKANRKEEPNVGAH
jgi:hypothetical protein